MGKAQRYSLTLTPSGGGGAKSNAGKDRRLVIHNSEASPSNQVKFPLFRPVSMAASGRMGSYATYMRKSVPKISAYLFPSVQ